MARLGRDFSQPHSSLQHQFHGPAGGSPPQPLASLPHAARPRSGEPAGGVWPAGRSVVLASACLLVTLSPLLESSGGSITQAQERRRRTPPVADTVRLAQAPQSVSFDIPAQRLTDALNAFAEAAAVQLSYPTALTTRLQSMAVAGTYTPAEALQQLLSGTGLTYRFVSANIVTLERVQTEQTAPPGNPPGPVAQARPPAPPAGEDADNLTLAPVTVEGRREAPSTAVSVSRGKRVRFWHGPDLQFQHLPAHSRAATGYPCPVAGQYPENQRDRSNQLCARRYRVGL